MKTSSLSQRNAFTLIELLVVIAIIAILAGLAVPAITSALLQGQLTQTVNNGRQILLAGSQMANDGVSTGDARLGWPGDLANQATNGTATTGSQPVQNVTGYITALQTYGYLAPTDVIKITLAPGVPPWSGTGQFNGATNCAFKIYKCTAADGASNLFCATKNFTYGTGLSATTVPYNAKGFVVVQKGGSALNLKPIQASGSNQLIGLLPGRQSLTDNPTESQTDILAQQ